MRILHTSDWHLGISLMGHKRYAEQREFLSWLISTINTEQIEVLLVSGDVFDSALPGSRAQELYYEFLWQMKQTSCQNIVIIGGNHDSPTFLNAPGGLLKHLGIHVVGSKTENPSDEVLLIKNAEGKCVLIVCAVPYLRERDIRSIEAYESIEQKEQKLLAGITKHYQDVFSIAFDVQAKDKNHPPIVALGHLFASGGCLQEGEAVRELYIGNLLYVPADLFPAEINYVALGHLHSQQIIKGRDNLRYSGSPLPLSFKEADHEKQVLIIDISDTQTTVNPITIPQNNRLLSIEGNWDAILSELNLIVEQGEPCWIEVYYTGDEILPSLKEDIESIISGTDVELLRLKNERIMRRALSATALNESLDDLSTIQVFERCLQKHGIDEPQSLELRNCYNEIMQMLSESDPNAEEAK